MDIPTIDLAQTSANIVNSSESGSTNRSRSAKGLRFQFFVGYLQVAE